MKKKRMDERDGAYTRIDSKREYRTEIKMYERNEWKSASRVLQKCCATK